MSIVNVLLKGSDIGITTDLNGRLSFPEKLQAGDVLIFTFIGYKRKELTIQENMEVQLNVELFEETIYLGTVMVTNTQHKAGANFFTRCWHTVTSWFK